MAWKGWKPAPLPSSFMLTAILGFIVSALWVFPQNSDWGFTFLLFFTLMFIAAVISMTHAPVQNLEALDARAEHRKTIAPVQRVKKRKRTTRTMRKPKRARKQTRKTPKRRTPKRKRSVRRKRAKPKRKTNTTRKPRRTTHKRSKRNRKKSRR